MKRLLTFISFILLFIPSAFVFGATGDDCTEHTGECYCPTNISISQHRAYHQANRGAASEITETTCKEDCLALSRTTVGITSWAFQCKVAGELTPINQGSLISLTSESTSGFNDVLPAINVDIPGYTQEALEQSRDISGNSNVLGVYINAVYNWLLIAGAVVAILVMMIGGLQYTLARGNAGAIGQAKDRITNAGIGMVLLLGAYVVAYLIDPNLTRFESLDISSIERRQYFPPNGEDVDTTPRNDINYNLVAIEGDKIIFSGTENQISADLLPNLQAAALDFHQKTGIKLRTASAFRSPQKQATLFYDQCLAKGGICQPLTCNPAPTTLVKQENGRFVLTGALEGVSLSDRTRIINTIASQAVLSKCPHTSAVGIDVWYEGSPGDFQADPKIMRKLAESMTKNGFCRLKSEPWHFELDAKKVSNACSKSNIDPNYTTRGITYIPDSNCTIWDFKNHRCVR